MQLLIQLNPSLVRSKLEEIQDAIKSKAELDGKLKTQQSNLKELKEETTNKVKSLENNKFDKIEDNVEELKQKFDEIDTEYIESVEVKKQIETTLTQHLELIKNQVELRKEISLFEEKLKDVRDDHDTFKHLEKLFSHIGGRILSRLRYQINVATIDILSLLGNPQLEGITLNEDFSITIQTPQGNEKPSFFSGGQKIRIGFAFRLALSKVLAEFRGNELDTLIIDEGGFGALDDDGQEGVIDVFKSLQDRFERVLVISHIPKITNNLPGAQVQIIDGKITEKIN
ncbi:MAG: hypothetical protein ACC656_05165 [Candidatus Heimdallarchaeota archaeon]